MPRRPSRADGWPSATGALAPDVEATLESNLPCRGGHSAALGRGGVNRVSRPAVVRRCACAPRPRPDVRRGRPLGRHSRLCPRPFDLSTRCRCRTKPWWRSRRALASSPATLALTADLEPAPLRRARRQMRAPPRSTHRASALYELTRDATAAAARPATNSNHARLGAETGTISLTRTALFRHRPRRHGGAAPSPPCATASRELARSVARTGPLHSGGDSAGGFRPGARSAALGLRLSEGVGCSSGRAGAGPRRRRPA